MQNADLASRIFDLDEISDKSGRIMYTGFMSPADAAFLAPLAGKIKGTLSFSAGYDGAERTVAVIIPKICKDTLRLPIAYLSVNVHGEEALSHRDIMGAILGLGIKREALGDIVFDKNTITVAVLEKIADYLALNLCKIGRATVELSPCGAPNPPAPGFKEITATVASLRLDSVVGEGFGISRSEAAEYIKKAAVCVNWKEQCSPSKEVKEGDKISLRGKGKILLYSVDGQSKKGRTFITLHRYI